MTTSSFNFEEVVKGYSKMVYGICYRLLGSREDAQEAVQEAFLKIYQKQNQFLVEKDLKNWIYTIGLNTARDFYRKNKRRNEWDIENHLEELQVTDATQTKIQVESMVGKLSQELREVVVLHYFEDYGVSEISKMLSIGESLVKVRLFRARQKMLEYARGSF
jgi:RNA polymerase sigma-70 factor (ECF subfamily)